MANPLKRCDSDPRLLAKCADPRLLLGCGDIGGLLWIPYFNLNAITLCEAETFPCNGFFYGNATVVGQIIPWNPNDPQSLVRRLYTNGASMGTYGINAYIDDTFCGDDPPICSFPPALGETWPLCHGGGSIQANPCARYYDPFDPNQIPLGSFPMCLRQIGLFDGNTEVGIKLRGRVALYREKRFFADGMFDAVTTLQTSCCGTLDESGGCVYSNADVPYTSLHTYKEFFTHYPPVPLGTACNHPEVFPRLGTLQVEFEIRSPDIRLPYNRAKHELVLQNPDWLKTNVNVSWQATAVSGICHCDGGPHANVTTQLLPIDAGRIGGVERVLDPGFEGFGRVTMNREVFGRCPAYSGCHPPCYCADDWCDAGYPQTTDVRIPDFPYLSLDFRSVD